MKSNFYFETNQKETKYIRTIPNSLRVSVVSSLLKLNTSFPTPLPPLNKHLVIKGKSSGLGYNRQCFSFTSSFGKVTLLIETDLMNFTCIKIKVIASWQQCAHLRKSLHLCIVFSCKYFCQNVLARNIILWFMVHVVSEKNNCITNQ